MKPKIIARDKEHLLEIIQHEINLYGNKCSLNHIDVSSVCDMKGLFKGSQFNGNISKWKTYNVKDMSYMFLNSKFDNDISNWTVCNVENMECIFYQSAFKRDVSEWQPYLLENIQPVFLSSKCPTPYWANFEEQIERNRAIESYHLHKHLFNELSDNNFPTKKLKI